MVLTGSFHTMTTHGRSGVTTSSVCGVSSRTGASVGTAIVLSIATSLSGTDEHGVRRPDGGFSWGGRQGLVQPHHSGPHGGRAGDVDADQERWQPGEVLGVADADLGD